jgi:hypothetical protein
LLKDASTDTPLNIIPVTPFKDDRIDVPCAEKVTEKYAGRASANNRNLGTQEILLSFHLSGGGSVPAMSPK